MWEDNSTEHTNALERQLIKFGGSRVPDLVFPVLTPDLRSCSFYSTLCSKTFSAFFFSERKRKISGLAEKRTSGSGSVLPTEIIPTIPHGYIGADRHIHWLDTLESVMIFFKRPGKYLEYICNQFSVQCG